MNDTTITRDEAFWHRHVCWVAPWLAVSGDLSSEDDRAARQLAEWQAAGITDVLDVRLEYSDEEFVAELAPQMRYHHVPADDDGGPRSGAWFRAGLAATAGVRAAAGDLVGVRAVADRWDPTDARPDRRVLVHCHMGVNRGPSMAYRLLLAAGWDTVGALDAIRAARPIAGILYAQDALADHLAAAGVSETGSYRERRRLTAWQKADTLDLARTIGRIRRSVA